VTLLLFRRTDGSIGILTGGASTGSVVKGQTVTDAVPSKRSFWTMAVRCLRRSSAVAG
jgi:hypothetical protein